MNCSPEEIREVVERVLAEHGSPAMVEGRLYECVTPIKIRGHLESGFPATATIEVGTPAVAVRTSDGDDGILVEGVVIPYSWKTFGWGRQFREVRDA